MRTHQLTTIIGGFLLSVLVSMFDVDSTLSRSQRLLISDDDEDVKVEFRRFPVSFSPYLDNSLSVASPDVIHSPQFVILLDFNRSVCSSQSQLLGI
jgi:hypothetical protein